MHSFVSDATKLNLSKLSIVYIQDIILTGKEKNKHKDKSRRRRERDDDQEREKKYSSKEKEKYLEREQEEGSVIGPAPPPQGVMTDEERRELERALSKKEYKKFLKKEREVRSIHSESIFSSIAQWRSRLCCSCSVLIRSS